MTVVQIADETWRRSIEYRWNNRTRENEIAPSLKNAMLLLLNDEAFRGCWRYDKFTHQTMLSDQLPHVGGMTASTPGRPIQDHDIAYQVAAFSDVNGISFSYEIAARAIESAARQVGYNSLHEHLDAMEWDGKERLYCWLYSYLGAEHTAYTSAVGRMFLVSAMARAYRPGCQADHVMTLEGRQGGGKSTAARILGGPFYLAKLPNLRDDTRASLALAGKWIVELGELDALRGAAATQAKEFISRPADDVRPPWGRFTEHRPRTCVMIGTTNEEMYLTDSTGARRSWPVRMDELNRDALIRDRDQLLAEAREAYRAGEMWHPTKEMEVTFAEEQEARYKYDEWEGVIIEWLDSGSGLAKRMEVSIGAILGQALEIDIERWDQRAQSRVGAIMKRLGWTSERVGRGKSKTRIYHRPGA